MKRFLTGILIILSVGFFSCKNDYYEDPIPERPVNFEINVNDPLYFTLHTMGYCYIDGKDRGVRGIILHKTHNNNYIAFERTCSFQPTSACANLDVHPSGQYLIDSCCGSTFNWQGEPIGSPAYLPLLRYQTTLNGSYLRIYNQL